MATPLPGSKVVPVPTVEVGSGPSATPTVQVPAGAMMSRHDMIMLFSREVPLAMAKPAAAGAAPGWATKANLAVKTAATDVREATSKFESLFSKILPRGSGENEVTLNASITIQKKLLVLDLTDLLADSGDDLAEVLGQHVSVQLVSTIVDPKTKKVAVSEEVPILNWVTTRDMIVPTNFKFSLEFKVPKDFGTPGAIIVKNRHVHEFLLVAFSVQAPNNEVVNFPANSWVYNTDFRNGRIFFSNEVYLPQETPEGLVALRQQELDNLRGDGDGERKFRDRIYDYATYNDLGNPDLSEALKRPVLGGSAELPYPRRMRTGRPPTRKDPKSESLGELLAFYYIPRDEKFDQVKFSDFAAETVRSGQHAIIPVLKGAVRNEDEEFHGFSDVRSLYAAKGTSMTVPYNLTPPASSPGHQDTTTQNPLTFIHEYAFPSGPDTSLITFPLPRILAVDDQAWSTDIEFAREMLSGLNPLVIKLLKEFPIKSTLDPAEFGDPLSAITAKQLEAGLEGLTVEQALAQKRLFVQDYHDIFLPYVNRINAQGRRAMYAPRTVVFLTSANILMPLAIELTLPPPSAGGKKKSSVFTPPPPNSTKNWVWELAKAHVASCDTSYHEVISHFLRSHATMEPFIIATNRQLSVLHPINQVLVPHYKNTMDINAAARKALTNAGGIIELNFTPGKYAMEMSSVVYKLDWRFDEQSLPEDLVKRGMAVRDPSAKHGLKLVIEDYPYAADGLVLWAAMKEYMSDHVKIFYKSDKAVQDDPELQSWWTEVRTVGHGDKKDSPGWPTLNSIENLVYILTTIAWVGSCHHAAVNFGQFAYAGYMPNHPSMTRKFIPEPGTKEWEQLQNDPEKFYLDSISNKTQATSVMSTIEILATHALDEEYLGQRLTPNWSNDERVLSAFAKFSAKIKDAEELFQSRNADKSLKNRTGPVQLPYELLFPTSTPGLTGRGVPNSVSI